MDTFQTEAELRAKKRWAAESKAKKAKGGLLSKNQAIIYKAWLKPEGQKILKKQSKFLGKKHRFLKDDNFITALEKKYVFSSKAYLKNPELYLDKWDRELIIKRGEAARYASSAQKKYYLPAFFFYYIIFQILAFEAPFYTSYYCPTHWNHMWHYSHLRRLRKKKQLINEWITYYQDSAEFPAPEDMFPGW
jgi:hypothetical protein